MTNHHDEMRVAPDPLRAEKLRRLLHARLERGSQDEPVVPIQDAPMSMRSVDAEPDDREGSIIMLEIEALPTGDQAALPRRRSPNGWRMAAAAAVAVIAIVGALLVAPGGDEATPIGTAAATPTTAIPTTAIPTTAAPARDALGSSRGPGRYFVDPDGDDATPLRVTFQTASGGFGSWFGWGNYLPEADGFTALSITTVTNLVSDGCRDHTPLDPPVGPTVDDLAIALSQLAPFEVTAPPTDVALFGYQGKHLELTVPDLPSTDFSGRNDAQFTDCVDGEIHSWISPINDLSFGLLGHSSPPPGHFQAYQTPGQTEEFWILDVDGTRVVLVSFDTPNAPADDIAERDAIFDTIRMEP